MPSSEAGDLAGRVEQLERQNERLDAWARRLDRQNRVLKWVGAVVALALAALVVLPRIPAVSEAIAGATGSPRLIATAKGVGAEEFSLRGPDGVQMSVLECDKFGAPNLVMVDLKRRYRVGLKVWDDDKVDLNLYDTQGRLRGRFGVGNDGEVALVLSTDEKREHARLSVTPDGRPSLRLTDADGKVVFQAP